MTQIDFLAISDLELPVIEQLAEKAVILGTHWQSRDMPQTLSGIRVGMIEELPGWRNPTAMALGVAAMGGICTRVTARLEGAEPIEDLAGYMDNWFEVMAVRTPGLTRLRSFARMLDAPVVNLRTHDNHPCEVLGDLAWVLSQRRSWDGLCVAMVGPAGNIARSWLEAAAILPIRVIQVAPRDFQYRAGDCGARVSVTDDLAAVETADLIVTDCRPADVTPDQKAAFDALRIDAAVLDRCKPDVLFVPCPPVTRGHEVSDDAMRHPRCLAKPAKAFLLHAQNAVVEYII